MASAYTPVYKYRDPERVDLAPLGNALQYKQKIYDSNVAQTQQLINQYSNSDIMKGLDKEYLGERLNTIVGYINQSGTRNWSRRSIATDIQNYVSNAIDKNVMNAIASTQAYRKQMAEIEEFKTKKPELYSLQNQWFATADYNRYMTSNKVGDVYNANPYVPYTDVQKHILDNASKLKDFGVEYHFDPIGGNQYFTRIGEYERIAPEEAKQYLNMILGTKEMNQLYIDGQYTFKDTNSENVKNLFDNRLNTLENYNNERINELRTLSTTLKGDEKSNVLKHIQSLEDDNKNIQRRKGENISKESMIDELYKGDFINKNVGFLSYNKLKGWKMDQSGFEMLRESRIVDQQNWENKYKIDKFNYDVSKDSADRELKERELQFNIASKGMKYDPQTGQFTPDKNSPFFTGSGSGINTADNVNNLEEVEKKSSLLTAEKAFVDGGLELQSTVADEVQRMIDGKDGNAELSRLLGNNNARQIAWIMVNSPSQAGKVYEALSDNSKAIIDKVRYNKNLLKSVDEATKPVLEEHRELGKAIANGKASAAMALNRASDGYMIDPDGNVIKGNVSRLNTKNKNAELSQTIAALNLTRMTSEISEEEDAAYRRMIENEINNSDLSKDQKKNAIRKMVYRKSNANVFSQVLFSNDDIRESVQTAGRWYDKVSNFITGTSDSNVSKDIDNYVNDAAGLKANVENVNERLGRRVFSTFMPNQTMASLTKKNAFTSDDIDMSKLSNKNIGEESITRWKNTIKNGINNITDYSLNLSKSVTVDLDSNDGKAMRSSIYSYFPVGTQFQKDGVVQFNIDPSSGLANVTASIKDGKDYEPATVSVAIRDLPQHLLNNVDMSNRNMMYSASNPHSLKYGKNYTIPEDETDWLADVELAPRDRRIEMRANRPTTQEDIVNSIISSYSPELIEKHASEIKSILSSPITIKNEVESGQWTIFATQNGKNIYTLETGVSDYEPSNMERAANKIATDAILQKIQKVMMKK